MADLSDNDAASAPADTAPPAAPAPAPTKVKAAPVPTIPLEEYMTELSQRDTRHELVNGFYSDERRAGKFHGTRAEYDARFAAFQNAPA